MKTSMQLQTNEAHYATANKWSTLRNLKQIKNTMKPQKMKHIMQLQTIEIHYSIAK
jgi:hypothetical protein